jgi:uncharacterized protein (DUF2235 family)
MSSAPQAGALQAAHEARVAGDGTRNLIVCLDGTSNAYGEANTNVVKFYAMLAHGDGAQLANYDPGVGTFSAQGAWTRFSKWLTKMMGLAFGFGLAQVLSEAYRFLQRNYREGDRVWIIGFSRGAYTARALAGFLHKCGLLHEQLHDLVPYAYDIYRKEHRPHIVEGFKATFARPCPVHFVGVWDTVSSVGWVWDPEKLPYTRENPSVAILRHAISIDERRAFYRSNRWAASQEQDAEEVWFAGVHSDVGGSYPEAESGLSQVTLQWMAEQARAAGLQFDQAAWERYLPTTKPPAGVPVPPDPLGEIHRSLRGAWWLMEIFPKWIHDPANHYRRRLRLNLGRRRFMREDDAVHVSVARRIQEIGYAPSNLPAHYRVQP